MLARAGARVVVFDRSWFPRPKLCGDSLNPGAVALLARLGLEERDPEGLREGVRDVIAAERRVAAAFNNVAEAKAATNAVLGGTADVPAGTPVDDGVALTFEAGSFASPRRKWMPAAGRSTFEKSRRSMNVRKLPGWRLSMPANSSRLKVEARDQSVEPAEWSLRSSA